MPSTSDWQVGDDALAGRDVDLLAVPRAVLRVAWVAQHDRAGPARHIDREPFELSLHAFANEGDLVALVVRVGEQELHQVVVDELARRPREDLDALMAAAGVGQQHVAGLPLGRCPEADAGERRGFDAERGPARGGLLVEQPVGLVEPQQVLALDVEDQHAQVRGALAQDLRMRREHAQEEQRERGLRGDAADAADRHVPALASVEEVEVDVHRELVATDPHGQRPAHLVDVERLVAFVALGALDRFAGVGRDPHLGVDPRDGDARGAHLRGRHDAEFGDPMGVGFVARALVDGFGFGDDAVRADLAGLRHLGAHHDQVVQLQEVVFVEHHAEGAGVGMLRTEDPADLALVAHEASCSIPGCSMPGRSMTASRSAR